MKIIQRNLNKIEYPMIDSDFIYPILSPDYKLPIPEHTCTIV